MSKSALFLLTARWSCSTIPFSVIVRCSVKETTFHGREMGQPYCARCRAVDCSVLSFAQCLKISERWAADPDADLCLCLLFVHPPSATEADFLFGLKPRSRGAKRKKGQQPINVGE